jgi:hypothetical protein
MCIWHVGLSLGYTALCHPPWHNHTKNMALVNALAKLHNYCIACTDRTDTSCEPTTEYLSNITTSEDGYVVMESVEGYDIELPLQLMDAGHHFNNIHVNQRQV